MKLGEIIDGIETGLEVYLPQVEGYWKGIKNYHGELKLLWFKEDGDIVDFLPTEYLFRTDWVIYTKEL